MTFLLLRRPRCIMPIRCGQRTYAPYTTRISQFLHSQPTSHMGPHQVKSASYDLSTKKRLAAMSNSLAFHHFAESLQPQNPARYCFNCLYRRWQTDATGWDAIPSRKRGRTMVTVKQKNLMPENTSLAVSRRLTQPAAAVITPAHCLDT